MEAGWPTPMMISNWFDDATAQIDTAPSLFVFNKEEMHYQEWCDAERRIVVIPCSCEHDSVPMAVPRYGRGIALVVTLYLS
jgi:hypothetical protein